MNILYWTGAGLGNLILATPAFKLLKDFGHHIDVFPEDVPEDLLPYIYPHRFVERPTKEKQAKYDKIIYSEFRGIKDPPVGKNVVRPKMKWFKETETEYHIRICCELFNIPRPPHIVYTVGLEKNYFKGKPD